jgi:hypothetical protein
MRRFPIRKLTNSDGEYILHHAIEHLYNISDESDGNQRSEIKCGPETPCEFCQAICTCRRAIATITGIVFPAELTGE